MNRLCSIGLMLVVGNAWALKLPVPVDAVEFAPIHFAAGAAIVDETQAAVSADARRALHEACATLKAFPHLEVLVAGYTDTSECNADACFELSRQRARAVAAFLIACGIDRSRINSVSGMGSAYPAAAGDSEPGRAMNRRVQISTVDDS